MGRLIIIILFLMLIASFVIMSYVMIKNSEKTSNQMSKEALDKDLEKLAKKIKEDKE